MIITGNDIVDFTALSVLLIAGVGLIVYFTFFSVKNKKVINESLEYLSRKRPRKPIYEPKQSVYERFLCEYTEFTALTAMAKDIMRHLGLPNNSIAVYPVDFIDGNAAGRYVNDATGNYIEVRIMPDTKPSEIMAILIHELMHYYLRSTGLGFNETLKNEILTDTATIYFGFGRFIDRGYSRVGYIKFPEIQYIKRKLAKGHLGED